MTNTLINVPVLSQSSTKTNHSFNTTYTTLVNEKYDTSPTDIRNHKPSPDSDLDSVSTSSSHSSSYETDGENVVNNSTKRVHFDDSQSKIDVQRELVDDKAKLLVYHSFENSTEKTPDKRLRKRDRVRLVFHKKFHRSHKIDTYDVDNNEWGEILVKSLVSMQHDVHEIIDGIDQMDLLVTDDDQLNSLEAVIITKPRLSFRERQREKLEMIRLAQMLHPPNLLTFRAKESPYPYTDIIEPYNFNFLRITKRIPEENLFIQHKPFRYRKLRYRTQRGLLKIRRDLKRIKRDLYGKHKIKSYEELPSLGVQNYRNRLEKNLLQVRRQINEYDRLHSLTNHPRKSISQIIARMSATDPNIQAQIEAYKTKYRSIEYLDKKHTHELNSAPYIPRRQRSNLANIQKENEDNHITDTRFDPNTFVDLNKEAEEFFGPEKPFWDQPSEARLPLPTTPINQESDEFILTPKLNVWDRFAVLLKSKRSYSRSNKSKQSDDNNNDFFDCISSPPQQRTSVLSTDENESVEF